MYLPWNPPNSLHSLASEAPVALELASKEDVVKFVDLNIGQPFRETTIGMIGRITQVHDSYLLADIRDTTTKVIYRRQVTIQDLVSGSSLAFHCPTLAEFDLPGGVILAVPSNILRYRSNLIGVHGLYRLGRFPLIQLNQEPVADPNSVVPLNEMAASVAQIEVVAGSLGVALSEARQKNSLEVTVRAACE